MPDIGPQCAANTTGWRRDWSGLASDILSIPAFSHPAFTVPSQAMILWGGYLLAQKAGQALRPWTLPVRSYLGGGPPQAPAVPVLPAQSLPLITRRHSIQ